jgi:hypothetical protein
LHPEVSNVCFLILLYAGICLLLKINYSLLFFIKNKNIVTMFIGNKIKWEKYRAAKAALFYKFYLGYAQSAGNSFISNIPMIIYYVLTKQKNKVNFTRTSETLRKKKIKNTFSPVFLTKSGAVEKKKKKLRKAKHSFDFFPFFSFPRPHFYFFPCFCHFSQRSHFCSFSLLKSSGKVKSHVPTHRKPLTDKEFGYYLAGLIDGDGCFTEKSLIIAFSEKDTSLAYYLKSYIAYGNVYKIKNKKAVVFTIAHSKGLVKVLSLVNGKLRYESKINNINNKLIPYLNSLKSNPSLNSISLEKTNDLNNHWLAGFSDADGSFQIKILERKKLDKTRKEVRLNFQIDQKTSKLLNLIKQNFGGNIGYREKQDTYYYGSTSFEVGKNFITYFDSYHLLSSKYINYMKWRKAYLVIQDKAGKKSKQGKAKAQLLTPQSGPI